MTQQKESLNPNKKSLAHFFGLHHLMGQNEIILVYSGEITQSQIKTLLAFTERKFSMVNMEDIVRRKIFNIMVEMLQNISKNAIDNTPEFSKFAPIFLIGETEEIFFL
ncbi:MAG: hypothetical protein KAS71_04655, partial [Bacteroidales bacterium]|nr:hypothetical protein [Bacteroidales bacterium]